MMNFSTSTTPLAGSDRDALPTGTPRRTRIGARPTTAQPPTAPSSPAARTIRVGVSWAGLLAALVAAALLLAPGGATAAPAGDGPTAQASAGKGRFGPTMVAELNRMRARHGLPSLRGDRRMARTARAHSRTMVRVRALFHGAWSARVARAAGTQRIGEVLARVGRARPVREARSAIRAWLRSPSHRAVLLDPSFRRVGVGRAVTRVQGHPSAIYTVDWAARR